MINLKERRLELNMSDVEAAFRLGVTTVTISNWESGKSTPSLAMKHKIASVYQCEVDELPFKPRTRKTNANTER